MCQQRLFLWWEMEKILIWTTLYVSQKYYRNSLPVSSKNEVVGLWMLWCATMKSILFYFQFSKNLSSSYQTRHTNSQFSKIVNGKKYIYSRKSLVKEIGQSSMFGKNGKRLGWTSYVYVCSAHSIVCHRSCTNLKKDLVIVTIASCYWQIFIF